MSDTDEIFDPETLYLLRNEAASDPSRAYHSPFAPALGSTVMGSRFASVSLGDPLASAALGSQPSGAELAGVAPGVIADAVGAQYGGQVHLPDQQIGDIMRAIVDAAAARGIDLAPAIQDAVIGLGAGQFGIPGLVTPSGPTLGGDGGAQGRSFHPGPIFLSGFDDYFNAHLSALQAENSRLRERLDRFERQNSSGGGRAEGSDGETQPGPDEGMSEDALQNAVDLVDEAAEIALSGTEEQQRELGTRDTDLDGVSDIQEAIDGTDLDDPDSWIDREVGRDPSSSPKKDPGDPDSGPTLDRNTQRLLQATLPPWIVGQSRGRSDSSPDPGARPPADPPASSRSGAAFANLRPSLVDAPLRGARVSAEVARRVRERLLSPPGGAGDPAGPRKP